MTIKEIIYKAVMTYFVLVTCISAAIIIIGSNINPDARLGYMEFTAPFKYAAVCVLPIIVMYSRKELSTKQVIIRKIIQLILVEAAMMVISFTSMGISKDRIGFIAVMSVSVLIIFLIANFIGIMSDFFMAKKMTKELMDFQKNAE